MVQQREGDGNQVAPPGQVWVCMECGKASLDRFGSRRISRGWDVSCFLSAVLCFRWSIVRRYGRVAAAKAVTTGGWFLRLDEP